jgi:hypothetical protein
MLGLGLVSLTQPQDASAEIDALRRTSVSFTSWWQAVGLSGTKNKFFCRGRPVPSRVLQAQKRG